MFMKEKWNAAIKIRKETWLQYKLSDIRYIIIKGEYDFEATCSVINTISLDEGIKNYLLSRILIWDDIKEDF